MSNWMERAVGRSKPSSRLLAEDEYGDLLVPSRGQENWWDRPFNPRNPLHWRFWLASRLTLNVVMVDREARIAQYESFVRNVEQ